MAAQGKGRVARAVIASLVAGLVVVAGPADAQAPPAGGEIVEMPRAVAGEYIVTLRSTVPRGAVADVADDLTADHDGTVLDTYRHTIRGFAAELAEADALALSQDPDVLRVEENAIGRFTTVQDTTPSPGVSLWGLDRIDQVALPGTETYTYTATGSGVTAYVLDSGVYRAHTQFGGRATEVFDAVDGVINDDSGDCQGHGTFVAGVVGGVTVGVAKSVALRSVRLGSSVTCGLTLTAADAVEAADWVTANATDPAVVNASWGFPNVDVPSVNDAVRASIASGLTWVVAAGNTGTDACLDSPQRVTEAIVVGASDAADARSSFSNTGRCVDLFAPGSAITSASYLGTSTVATAEGTSFAAPFVTGVVARYLQGNTTATPAQVALAVVGAATPDRLTGVGTGSPNRLLFSGFLDSIAGGSPTGAPTNDGFGAAVALTGRTGHVVGTNFAATVEAGEPAHATALGNRSVWYTWTAPVTGNVTFSTCDRNYDTVLAVYTGTAVDGLTLQAASDDATACGNGSQVTFLATAGTAYRIAVGGFNGAAGSFVLTHAQTPQPVVNTLSVNAGPVAGGGSVTITGANLSGATGVSFGPTATTFSVTSPTVISAVIPARPAGAVNVTVTTPGGTSVTNAGNQYTYFATPAITGLSTASGPWAGGTPVTITGTGLSSFGTLTFGGVATPYTAVSDTEITTVSPPAGAGGPVGVVLTTPGGTSATSPASQFTYTIPPPVVASATPTSGPPTGGTEVTLTGTGLHGATEVTVAGTPVGFGVASDTSLSLTTPPGTVGPAPIVVTNPTGSSTPVTFTYRRPANDGFGSPRVLNRSGFDVTGSTAGATRQTGEPKHAGSNGGASVWYRWTPSRTATVTICTTGSAFDTVLAVYRGSAVNRLTKVVANDDHVSTGGTQSRVRFRATAGTTYRIAVDGFKLDGFPVESGAVRLRSGCP